MGRRRKALGCMEMRELRRDREAAGRSEPILLEDRALLKVYYSGQRLPSPVGGHLDVLGSRTLPDGSAELLLECNTSSLRFRLRVPKGTRRDREKVREQIDKGDDPRCPRCRPDKPLVRAGVELHCPCGASYGKAP